MIVPQPRLILWAALAVPPFAGLATMIPASAPACMAVIGGVVLAALVDALRCHGSLGAIRLRTQEVVRLQKDRPGQFDLQIENSTAAPQLLRIAAEFPETFETPTPIVETRLPADAPISRIPWTLTARKRGRFHLDRFHLEQQSPWGFWAVRRTLPVQGELRVYPDLKEERKRVAALFLNRGRFGIHNQRQTGQGREFEKLREYVPGDSFDEIHWKASARRNRPITKVFQIERTQEVYVVLDTSRLSARDGSLERFITAALMLGLAAEDQGDLFGLVTFSDRPGTFLRAGRGSAHFDSCRESLYTLEPSDASPDFDEICSFLRTRLRKRALLVFLTALDDPVLSQSFCEAARVLRRRHLLFVNMLRPARIGPLFNGPGAQTVDEVYERLGGHLLWHELRELEKKLQHQGVHFSLLENERLSAQLISQYLSVKARQLL